MKTQVLIAMLVLTIVAAIDQQWDRKLAIQTIKDNEGVRLKAYICTAGTLTIGYGHTGDVKPGQTITAAKAEALLVQDLDKHANPVLQNLKVRLNDNQIAALISFTFNFGENAFKTSTLLRRLNQGQDPNMVAAEELPIWKYEKDTNPKSVTYGQKVPTNGLINRRNREIALFTRPVSPKNVKTQKGKPQTQKLSKLSKLSNKISNQSLTGANVPGSTSPGFNEGEIILPLSHGKNIRFIFSCRGSVEVADEVLCDWDSIVELDDRADEVVKKFLLRKGGGNMWDSLWGVLSFLIDWLGEICCGVTQKDSLNQCIEPVNPDDDQSPLNITSLFPNSRISMMEINYENQDFCSFGWDTANVGYYFETTWKGGDIVPDSYNDWPNVKYIAYAAVSCNQQGQSKTWEGSNVYMQHDYANNGELQQITSGAYIQCACIDGHILMSWRDIVSGQVLLSVVDHGQNGVISIRGVKYLRQNKAYALNFN